MMDPSDRELAVYREGDADILPTPTGGAWGSIPESDIESTPGLPPKMYQVYGLSLGAGSQRTIDAGQRPDYWVVSLDGTANSELSLYPYDAPAASPVLIGPNGEAVIAGLSDYLSLVSSGSATARGTAIAVRGHLVLVRIHYGG